SPSHFIPLAAPGVVVQALKWLGDPESPFYVRLRPDLDFLAWAVRFWRAATPARARRAAPLLRDLNLASRALYEELAAATGNEFALTQEGLLLLFRSQAALDLEARHAEHSRSLGMPATVLDPAGIAALEPELTMDAVGGVHYPLDAHVTPQRFCAVLERLIQARGGVFVWNSPVSGFRATNGTLRAAITPTGEHDGDEFVVAAGSWSADLLRTLGVRIALQPGKGYSLTVETPPERPKRSLILQERRVAITPMGSTVRFGGTMELGARSLGVNPPRIRGIVRSAGRYLPAFTPERFASVSPWSGLRPCTPDGLPYLGRTERYQNLIVATGHAMLGLSLGPITGRLVSDVISGETPTIDLRALRPERYG
ncbi:MAG TPA: FAD-dependent oxidoreductase, partial [Candidatus Eisenbacteria bacterium]|nr:FAD-dependent oxidoreductase [Candidatus Eisenbacteria bacterium]